MGKGPIDSRTDSKGIINFVKKKKYLNIFLLQLKPLRPHFFLKNSFLPLMGLWRNYRLFGSFKKKYFSVAVLMEDRKISRKKKRSGCDE
ncbi:MAG: hypothetical protein CM15mP58_18620 [Burkholderiaceae bacterium]|nr:MAG: hypothetical protein CM15mP58_18620 [Burkholderiaceae bacterium]